MKNLKINIDWEHEFLKDYIYLQEENRELDQKIQKELRRQPAKITVVDKDKILEKKHEHQYQPLPF
jgi:hypothetical protein